MMSKTVPNKKLMLVDVIIILLLILIAVTGRKSIDNNTYIAKDIEELPQIDDTIPMIEHKQLSEYTDYIPIYTAHQFDAIGDMENNDYVSKEIFDISNNYIGTYTMSPYSKYVLMNDIIGIKGNDKSFFGVFDGNGYTISQLNYSDESIESASSSIAAFANEWRGYGLFGRLENATVKNLIVESALLQASGAIGTITGVAIGDTSIDNCYIKDCIIESNNIGAVGGIIGTAGNSADNKGNLTINNCMVISTIINTGKVVNDNEIEVSTAGIVGWSSNTTCTISNCKVLNNKENLDEYVSGIIDFFNGELLIIESCKVQNLDLISSGIIRMASGAVDIKKCMATNLDINTDSYSFAGTILGCGNNKITIEECEVSNINLNCKNIITGVGGIVGVINGEQEESSIKSCKVNNLLLDGENVIAAGAIVGDARKSLIDNCKVYLTSITNIGGHTGGITGVAIDTNINQCILNNSSVELRTTEDNQMIGGIVGCHNGKLISKCEVIDTSIKQNKHDITRFKEPISYAGGIAGYGTNITECKVKGTIIYEKASYSTGGIVGSAGDLTESSIIANCVVEDSLIEGGSTLGGMAGSSAAKITECRVISTEIIGWGTVGGIQGHGGATNTPRIISNCSLNKTSIKIWAPGDYFMGEKSLIHSFNTGEVNYNNDLIINCTYDDETVLLFNVK